MMSLAAINQLSAEAAAKAAKKGLTPYFMEQDDLYMLAGQSKDRRTDVEMLKHIPNLGDHEPEGFTLVDNVMVDKTGFGDESEPALTIGQFIKSLEVGKGYAIIEEGQFQIVMGIFEKEV